uniref:ORF195 n=1 Tax=Desulfovibrio desulfuricans TaxID=876 RepID=Q06362_DESDE|nr:ORF195 [Desulfovibrio desulfuricans]
MVDRQLTLPGEIVKKSNALARAKWSPKSVWEPRMVALVASMVRQDDADFQEYRFPVSTLCDEQELSGKRYKDIKAAVENVMKAYVMIEEGKNYVAYSIFSKCGYENGVMVAAFHPDLKPHFLGLQKQFTRYSLMEFLVLPSTYSQRVFEVLRSWDDKPEVTIHLLIFMKWWVRLLLCGRSTPTFAVRFLRRPTRT